MAAGTEITSFHRGRGPSSLFQWKGNSSFWSFHWDFHNLYRPSLSLTVAWRLCILTNYFSFNQKQLSDKIQEALAYVHPIQPSRALGTLPWSFQSYHCSTVSLPKEQSFLGLQHTILQNTPFFLTWASHVTPSWVQRRCTQHAGLAGASFEQNYCRFWERSYSLP